MNEQSDQPIVMRLRQASSGREVWRVQDKDDKIYCIEFEGHEKHEAEWWWNDAKDEEWNKNRELALVRVYSQADRLMQEAEKRIERLEAALQAIVKHQDMMGGGLAKMSTTWLIAARALTPAEINPGPF